MTSALACRRRRRLGDRNLRSANRLTSQGNQRWRQGDNGIQDRADRGDDFGSELVAGDFDGDGFKDLAIGVPREDGGEGVVHAIYGEC